jgi:cell division transport system permease protein
MALNAWLRQHLAALADALSHVRRARGSFSLNVLVIAIALALPFAGLTLVDNLQPVAQRLAVDPAISVFVATDTPRAAAQALAPQLQKILDAAGGHGRIAFISREDALASLQAKSGIADAVAALGSNPLPDAYVLTLEGFAAPTGVARIDAMVTQLAALPGVEQVQVDSAWVKRLAAMLQVLRVAVLLLAAVLAVVVLAVAFNTIRLQVMTQQEEIAVARLVGATDRFIYRPFYYTGALLGAVAGVLAMVCVALALYPLNQAIADFARLYGTEFRLMPLGWLQSLGLLALSALLGLGGSALSVRRLGGRRIAVR